MKTKRNQASYAVIVPEGKTKYHLSYHCKINTSINIHLLRQSNEIRLQGNLLEESFYLVARKGKLIIMFARTKNRVHYNICSIFLSTNNKSVKLQIFTPSLISIEKVDF